MGDETATIQPDRHCLVCGRSFPVQDRPGRPRIWCSDACRKRAHRRRRLPALEATLDLPIRFPKSSVIYECSQCDTRFVGVQYCPDCHTFCSRLGPGGSCPSCDEPVLVSDLIPS